MSNYTLTKEEINNEWELIKKVKTNPSLFRELYTKYYEPIFRFVYKRCADENLSADLTSQTFLKAMNKIKDYTFKGVPFSAWLFRIASNEVALYFRKNNKKRVVTLEDKFCNNITDDYSIEYKETLELNIETLKKVLQTMKPEEVELIELRFFEKRSFKEIGEIMSITENNAKVKTFRILKKMRKKF